MLVKEIEIEMDRGEELVGIVGVIKDLHPREVGEIETGTERELRLGVAGGRKI